MSIIDPALRQYADQLESAGFTIYEPIGRGNYFRYSQVVHGTECFGYVQRNWGSTGYAYVHTMPNKPSIEHGSSMRVQGANNDLSVATAAKVAQPINRNPDVGVHANYSDPLWEQLYQRRGAEQ